MQSEAHAFPSVGELCPPLIGDICPGMSCHTCLRRPNSTPPHTPNPHSSTISSHSATVQAVDDVQNLHVPSAVDGADELWAVDLPHSLYVSYGIVQRMSMITDQSLSALALNIHPPNAQ